MNYAKGSPRFDDPQKLDGLTLFKKPSLEEILAGLPDEAKRLIEELGLVAISAGDGEVKGQYSGKS